MFGKVPSGDGDARWAIQEPRGVEGSDLEAQKDRIVRQPGFGGRHANIGGVIVNHVAGVCAGDHDDDERNAVDGVARDDENRALASLLPAYDRVERDEVDLTFAGHRADRPLRHLGTRR